MLKNKEKVEFGDFQTPAVLAKKVVEAVSDKLSNIQTIIEPTCGTGTFLKIFTENNYNITNLIGWEVNPNYVKLAKERLPSANNHNVMIIEQDVFEIDWCNIENTYKKPVLFIGNPPWVTSAELGKLLGNNIPKKNNFQQHTGFEAITGKSNFDISEWILIKIVEFVSNSRSLMAFLIKTSVARKIFLHIAKNNLAVSEMFIREIDAKKYFNASVDACLFYAKGCNQIPTQYFCPVYKNLETTKFFKKIGVVNNKIIADVDSYNDFSDIDTNCEFKWRSGIKHDCSKVMELTETEEGLVNGYKETVNLPYHYLYPMYKSSDIAKDTLKDPKKWMLVTQKKIGGDTQHIETESPKTWEYLTANSDALKMRKSSIYKNSPRFSIFGIGDYSFKNWKIAISGLYKNIKFTKLCTYKEKPIVVDDTCYMLGFDAENKAQFILELLESDIAKKILESLVFKDTKRPITSTLLNRINFHAIAIRLGRAKEYDALFTAEENQENNIKANELNTLPTLIKKPGKYKPKAALHKPDKQPNIG